MNKFKLEIIQKMHKGNIFNYKDTIVNEMVCTYNCKNKDSDYLCVARINEYVKKNSRIEEIWEYSLKFFYTPDESSTVVNKKSKTKELVDKLSTKHLALPLLQIYKEIKKEIDNNYNI